MFRDYLQNDIYWWLFCFLLIVIYLFLIATSLKIGKKISYSIDSTVKSQVTTSGQTMLVLTGFLLAICLSTAESRFVQRKKLVLEEANAIGTAYLRTDLLPEFENKQAKELLVKYTENRLDLKEIDRLPAILQRNDELQKMIWENMNEARKKTPNSIDIRLYIQSVNEIFDLHTNRLTTALIYHTPPSMIYALFIASIVSLGTLGAAFGISGAKNIYLILGPVLLFNMIFILIVDMDQTKQRFFTVGQEPTHNVYQQMTQKK